MTLQEKIEQEADKRCYGDEDYRLGFTQGANFAIGMVDWISVYDRLPELDNKTILVWHERNKGDFELWHANDEFVRFINMNCIKYWAYINPPTE